MTQLSGQEFVQLLNTDSETGFKLLFEEYYQYLCMNVFRIIGKQDVTEDIVQDVFFEIWKKREQIMISTSLKAYLRRAAINKSLNHIRDQKMVIDEDETAISDRVEFAKAHQLLELEDLQGIINVAIDQLPEKCRIVFAMSRFEEMSYREIAESLGISIKTVENQISKALRHLRKELAPYLTKINY